MFGNLFGAPKLRPSERGRFVRPELEYLEARNAPSAMQPMDPGGPHGPPPGPPGGPPGHVNVNQHINAHDSFNTNINDSFNTSINNVVVNQFITAAATPPAALQQTFQANLTLAAQQNFQALVGLVTDEAVLAADTYFTLAGSAALNNPSLVANMHALQLAIQSNPLEATETGEATGYLTFDLVLQAYVSANTGV